MLIVVCLNYMDSLFIFIVYIYMKTYFNGNKCGALCNRMECKVEWPKVCIRLANELIIQHYRFTLFSVGQMGWLVGWLVVIVRWRAIR